MKNLLIIFLLLFVQTDIFSQLDIIIHNHSEKQINYVYKNCFEDNLSFIIEPNDSSTIKIDSLSTLPLQVFFPNSGNLFYSVFCLENDTLKISSKNSKLIIKNSRVQETELFEKLNNKDFYSQLLWAGLGYNIKHPNMEEHFSKCKETEKRALIFLDSLNKITTIRLPIKKIIDLSIRLNILGAYLTPGYVWGKEITFAAISKVYKDSVLKKSLILNKMPQEWSQYAQLTLFNLVRFLNFSEKQAITQETIFNVFKEQFNGINRDNGCFQTLKFGGDIDLKLYYEFAKFAEDKKYVVYFKSKIDEINEIDLFPK